VVADGRRPQQIRRITILMAIADSWLVAGQIDQPEGLEVLEDAGCKPPAYQP
jgi:hypothetical protein